MKASLLFLSLCLCGCNWLHAAKPPPPEPPELIVTGAPEGSVLFIDGVQKSPAKQTRGRPQIFRVVPGAHVLEVHQGDAVVYRESLDVEAGAKRVVTVLSGSGGSR